MSVVVPTDKTGKLKSAGKAAGYRAKRRFILISLVPVLLLFGVFAFLPIAWSLGLSVFKYDPLSSKALFVGADNYIRMARDAVFLKSLWVTFKFVTITVLINIVITLLIASAIQRVRIPWLKSLFRTVFFLPTIAPLAGTAIVWSTMFNYNNGLFNILLAKLHMAPIQWLSDPHYALYSVIMMTLWADIGYNIVLFIAGLDSIPDMYYEAAILEGAGRRHIFFHITLPLLRRTLLFVSVTTVVSYFQAFPQFQIMTKGEPFNETRVLALHIYDQAFANSNMGYASAMATVFLMIILLVTLLQLRWGRTQWEH
ncbi:MAG: sugar ABC transporter permease [Paenibacillus macerans]|uniref:ABC transporter permease subunit n=1 Tax=Paenibacillus macerans TaxID=44252 RepID=A0A090YR56_PAEMA|nr:sugar ABC transporter permease [Paenibacillus macerans]KFM94560.1 binding--dependent transport system inner membrane component family protein [Paenibacillus macerans]MBS5909625.1 sugar ABC transporter permease [Paenibacillus macerans]MCY7557290.1 sugar ABC transporter permease [Paenibacillus macerans]MDU7471786.1 sugar ABC transporter permease [Paenibacillus macerans]MEC0151732.1 sugar ABC transporter permease [Paenibacillus macerans]